jgi:hypothetical protein
MLAVLEELTVLGASLISCIPSQNLFTEWSWASNLYPSLASALTRGG